MFIRRNTSCARTVLYVVLVLAVAHPGGSFAQRSFHHLDSLFAYAKLKSTQLQSGHLLQARAKKARAAALYGVFDPNSQASFSYTDNTRLPVSLFPAEIFGGQPGTYQEIQAGIQYVSNANFNAEIKLLNPEGWAELRSAKINVELTASDNKLSLKNLQASIASAYFTIVHQQEQLKASLLHTSVADTLFQLSAHKLRLGLAQEQEVRDAQVNYLNSKESCNQIRYSIRQNYDQLKLLCDIPVADSVLVDMDLGTDHFLHTVNATYNPLGYTNSFLREQMARASYRKALYAQLPTVSVFASFTRQQFNAEANLVDPGVRWIPSSYLGFKISVPLPFISARSLGQLSKSRYDHLLARVSTQHSKLESEVEFRQLLNAREKAESQYLAHLEVYNLRKSSYQSTLHLYNSGLTDMSSMLKAFSALTSSNYDLIASLVTMHYRRASIHLNNSIK